MSLGTGVLSSKGLIVVLVLGRTTRTTRTTRKERRRKGGELVSEEIPRKSVSEEWKRKRGRWVSKVFKQN
jgi:hypothetical protein